MPNHIFELKKNIEAKFIDLRVKRKSILSIFKEKIRQVKIEQIKNSILGK